MGRVTKMKTRSSLLFFALAAFAAAPFLRADQPDDAPPPPPPDLKDMRAERLARLDETLKLTDAQKAQINAIWDQSEAAGKALREDQSLSRGARHEKMRELMKTTQEQVRAVLTPEQQKLFDAMRPPRPERKGHRPPPPPDEGEPQS